MTVQAIVRCQEIVLEERIKLEDDLAKKAELQAELKEVRRLLR